MEIFADNLVAFPDREFLAKIKSSRGNVFFLPPEIAKGVDKCYPPSFSISKCNETGKWVHYNEYTERACISFTDPFNHTYKNVYCHFCNEDPGGFDFYTNNTEKCEMSTQLYASDERPGYSAVVNIDTVLGSDFDNQLTCRKSQFRDQKMVRHLEKQCISKSNAWQFTSSH